MWNNLLNSTLSKSTKWPALHYIYQNPQTGEWVASDNRVMLCELNGAIPMFEFWDAQGNPCAVVGLEYDYQRVLNQANDWSDSTLKADKIKYKDIFAYIGERMVLASEVKKVLKFVGPSPLIKYSKENNSVPIYFQSVDKNLQAVIMPIKQPITGWKVLDVNEEIITVCNSYQEAEAMGELLGVDYIIRAV